MIPQNLQIDDPALMPVAEKVMAGERLGFQDGVTLYNSPDLLSIGYLAHQAHFPASIDQANTVLD